MFSRTIRLMDAGIRPMCGPAWAASAATAGFPPARRLTVRLSPASYVFDGKAPEMKAGELAKR
jgi:hypothetical protein